MQLSGYYSIDGKDIYMVYKMFIESGSDSFLKYPGKKESITHDWRDADGLDVDLSRVFFNARDIVLNAAIIVNNEQEFFEAYEGFIAHMKQPGLRRIEVTRFGGRSFYCYYKECNNFSSFTRFQSVEKIACKFTIVFTESNPSLNNSNVYIVDEQGRYLIT